MKKKQNVIKRVGKSVIERKILAALEAALDDEPKVTILCTAQDLTDLISSLTQYGNSMGYLRSVEAMSTSFRCAEFAKGLQELKDTAFPQ